MLTAGVTPSHPLVCSFCLRRDGIDGREFCAGQPKILGRMGLTIPLVARTANE